MGILEIYRSGGNWWKQEDLLIRGYYIGTSILCNIGTRLEGWSRHKIECNSMYAHGINIANPRRG
jgi:hypothetical protein